MQLWQAIVLAVVEGITEYLPISSTGHIVLTSWLMDIHLLPFTKDFTVMVQFGAILAVLVIYWKKFMQDWRLTYPRLLVAFLPAGIIGLLVKSRIDLLLGNIWVVAVALLLGGFALVFTKSIFRKVGAFTDINEISLRSSLIIGLFQCLAFVPGVSRAASTIWGGLFVGLSLPLATQFSFLLAVPTLSGATLIKALKIAPTLSSQELWLLFIGNLVSFAVGYLAIRSFMGWLGRRGLEPFGYYRIALGLLVIGVLYMGNNLIVI